MVYLAVTSLSRRSWLLMLLGICITISMIVGLYSYFVPSSLVEATPIANRVYDGWGDCDSASEKEPGSNCCPLSNGKVKLYDTHEFFCCNRSVHRRGHHSACCEDGDISSVYNKKESQCCRGKLYKLVPGGNYNCCGDLSYNKETHFCCADTNFIPARHYTFNSTSRSHCPTSYCGKEPIWGVEKLCCKGKLLSRDSNNQSCCGETLYHRNTEVCCNGHKHNKIDNNGQCCGNNYVSGGGKCCGEKILREGYECCGRKTQFHPNKSICTADSKIVPIGTPLCGQRKYDSKTQICCDTGTPMTFKNVGDDKCCKFRNRNGEGSTYNSKNATCEDGRVYSTVKCGPEHTKDKFTCCNGMAYDQRAENSVCCNGRAEWYSQSNPKNCWKPLCNDQWFNYKTRDCCNNKIINRRKFRCIDGQAKNYYNRREWKDTSEFSACGSYAISSRYNCCAGLMPYKTRQYKCPISEFGEEKPIKPVGYPFKYITICTCKKMIGKIIKVEEIDGRLRIVLRERESQKIYTIIVSNKQKNEIDDLKKAKSVNVFYETMSKNELFLGEYGAIEKREGRRHRHNNPDRELCKKIRAHFQPSSS